MSSVTARAVTERLDAIRHRLTAAGGADVRVVAVTKGFGADAVEAAVAAGIDDIGENYAQEMVPKLEAIEPATRPNVHFIGTVQRNKVRMLAPLVDVWQTVDRVALGAEIAKRTPGARVMIQVDTTDEPSKHGCSPEEVDELLARLGELGLEVVGLMGIGPLGPPEQARAGFRLIRSLVDSNGLPECSMGMSSDLEVAVQEGATMVRIGTALFGPRPTRAAEVPDQRRSGR